MCQLYDRKHTSDKIKGCMDLLSNLLFFWKLCMHQNFQQI